MDATEPPTVLVVDDELWVRGLIADALRDEGYRVLEAPNGHAAIRVVNEPAPTAPCPDLVLLDVRLPGIDGLQVLQQLAAPGGRVPVVMMSTSPEHLAAALATGADAVLPKPFELDRLVGVVDAYCPHVPR
jgi:two-component system response regulator (stage 0 sporulation protein F)